MKQIKQKPQLHASWIDPHAKEIVRILQKEGFTTYLVGGCVRDLLAGFHPKDYDIATNAHPNQVKRKVWGSYVIGRRFRLVLAKRGTQQYEIATFRQDAPAPIPEEDETSSPRKEALDIEPPTEIITETTTEITGEIPDETPIGIPSSSEAIEPIKDDNVFGTPEQDALRRDFTINALFYDPIQDELIDYTEGVSDIKNQWIRIIGIPDIRIQEDPIRIFRAIRLSHKLGFRIEPSLRESIHKNSQTVLKSVLPRRREEFLKLLKLDDPVPAFLELHDLGILQACAPSLSNLLDNKEKSEIFLDYLRRVKEFISEDPSPAELFVPLILGFISCHESNEENSRILNQLMRDELMIFKGEQAAILGAIDFVEQFKSIDSFKKRGARRQLALLRNENFAIALRIAKADFRLSSSEAHFWEEQLKSKFYSQDLSSETEYH